jgi:hypothetical protein
MWCKSRAKVFSANVEGILLLRSVLYTKVPPCSRGPALAEGGEKRKKSVPFPYICNVRLVLIYSLPH